MTVTTNFNDGGIVIGYFNADGYFRGFYADSHERSFKNSLDYHLKRSEYSKIVESIEKMIKIYELDHPHPIIDFDGIDEFNATATRDDFRSWNPMFRNNLIIVYPESFIHINRNEKSTTDSYTETLINKHYELCSKNGFPKPIE